MNFYDLKSHLAVLALLLGVVGIVGCGSKTNAIQTPDSGSGDTSSIMKALTKCLKNSKCKIVRNNYRLYGGRK